MKRTVSFICIAVIFSSVCFIKADTLSFPNAKAVVLINDLSGEVLYGKNENTAFPMASTTKIMTAILSIEAGNLYEEFTVDSRSLRVEGTSMGLKEGDKVTLYDLCVGMLLSSGNDAAGAAAVRVAGSEKAFIEKMNQKAKDIGMKNTRFETVSGLDKEGHSASAYDMALLSMYALKNETFKEICQSKAIALCFGKTDTKRTLYNHNKLLTMDEDIIGVKTGFTKKAGRCLVSAKEINGVRLIAVTLNASDDWNTHLKLYEYGFSKLEKTDFPKKQFKISVAGSEKSEISLSSAKGELYHIGNIKETVYLPKFLTAPIKKGEKVGDIRYFSGNGEIASVPIFAEEDAEKKEKISLWDKIRDFFKKIFEKLGF